MNKFLNLLFIPIYLLCLQISTVTAQPISSSEIEEIKKFASLENGKGQLLTPIRGSISSEVLELRDYIKSIAEELAGAELKAKDAHYVVNIYGNHIMNAWIQQLNPEHEKSQEALWKKDNPNEIWPLRKAWGFADDGKPIYELGITTNLINKLFSKDELAFIMGHELTHLLEGHTDHSESNKDSFKKWWSSQSHEVTADHLSIDKILGKYELDAALSVMEKLHPKKKMDLTAYDAIQAGMGTHHAEGVRLTLLQSYIEYLRHFNSKAQPKIETEIPQKFKLNVFGRTEKIKTIGESKSIDAYLNLIEEMLLEKEKTSELNFTQIKDENIKKNHEHFEKIFPTNNAKGLPELLLLAVEKINNSNASKIVKINSFFKVLIFLGSRASSYDDSGPHWFKNLSDTHRFQLTKFLLINSLGTDAWTLADFQKLMKELRLESRKYIEGALLGNSFGQSILNSLTKTSENWRKFIEYQTTIDSFIQDGLVETRMLGLLISNLNDKQYPSGPIRDIYRQNLARSLANYDRTDLLIAKTYEYDGLSEFRFIETPFTNEDSTEQQLQWRQTVLDAKKNHMAQFQKIIFDQLIKILTHNKLNLTNNYTMQESFSSALIYLNLEDLPSRNLETLRLAFDYQINEALNPERYLAHSKTISVMEVELLLKFIEDSNLNRNKVLDYLRYILSGSTPGIENISTSGRSSLQKIFNSLTKQEIWYITETLSPMEKSVWQEVDHAIKKYHLRKSDLLTHSFTNTSTEEAINLKKTILTWGKGLAININIQNTILDFAQNFSIFNPYKKFDFNDLKRLLKNIEYSKYMANFSLARFDQYFTQLSGNTLFEIFYQNIDTSNNFQELIHTYERVLKITGDTFSPPQEMEKIIRQKLQTNLAQLSLKEQFHWLKKDSLRKAVGGEFTGQQLAQYVGSIAKSDRIILKFETEKVLNLIPLREKWPDAYQVFRNHLSEIQNVQPHELKTIFKEDNRTTTEKIDIAGNLIRGMSSFSTYTRSLPQNEQIEMIEFMMGRSEKKPKSLNQSLSELKNSSLNNHIDLIKLFYKMREEMKYRTTLERAMVVNSVLTGPNAMIATPEGLKNIHQHILKAVSPANQEIASILLNALSRAEGRNKSLMLAYALSQKNEANSSNKGLTEASVLRSLLDAYGVPGVKLAQYLAFTSEFKDFQTALETYQDAAMPISYYEALLLLQKRLGEKWDPSLYRVIKIIGSGSVNIAIEYQNLQSGQNEVVTIARNEIEVKTKEDFRRFKMLMKELTSTKELRKKFEFVVGLLGLIEKSVTLEFDKQHSFEMQKSVKDLYRQTVDGWNIQTIDAFSVEGMAIRMEKAPGIGATKLLKTNPTLYESAMRAFMQVEYKILRGVDQSQNWIPVPLHANPDLHDGQIMVDVETKTITVLDFGQALKISNIEREFALDLLRIISKAESVNSAYDLLTKYAHQMQATSFNLNKNDLSEILNRGDRMDVFVHLLSALQKAKFEAPLSTVHWVLAANRLIKLGEKVRLSPESSIKWMLGMRKLGTPLTLFNAVKSVSDKFKPLLITSESKKSNTAVSPISCKKLFTN